MSITVYSMAYNEEVIMEFFAKHYHDRFPGCRIVIYDNQSTDRTAEIARANDCEVVKYNTNGQVDDDKLRNLKNSCWKDATTEWVAVCDMDEMLEINVQQLTEEDAKGVTLIKSEGYNMVNLADSYDIPSMKHGSRCPPYDKIYLFKRSVIQDINYTHGGHHVNPVGQIKYSDKLYLCYHYININPELTYKKHQYTKTRLSQRNKQMGWGNQYTTELTLEQVHVNYRNARTGVHKIRD